MKFTARLYVDWSMSVKPEPFTCAELLWFDAPAPVACCCEVDELPALSLPTVPIQ
ncbi:hypothetical protein ACWD7Y_01720 [Streptomyces drozdowiczii]